MGEAFAPSDATKAQLILIGEIGAELGRRRIDWWLFGGWAMDFNVGEITRDHSDIEIFVWQKDADAARNALTPWGFAAPTGLYPLECQSFLKDGQEIGCWFLVRNDDGLAHTPGRWAGWPWAAGSFDEPPLRLQNIEARVMSIAGLLDMMESFPKHPHGAPLRQKDLADLAVLRGLLMSATNSAF